MMKHGTVFSTEQLNALRNGYDSVQSIPLDKVPALQAMMNGMSAAALAQVAGAKIKFLSGLALNRCVRLGIAPATEGVLEA